MREINLTFANFGNRVIPIGTAGENLAMQVKIDCSAPLAEHPGAHAVLTVNPPSGGEYTGETWTDGTDVYWKVQNSDLLVPGRGNVVLSIIDNLGMILETAAAIIVIQDNNESGALPKWLDDLIAKALYLDSIAEPAAAGAVAAKLLAEAAATNAAASAADAAQYTAAAIATWLEAHPEATTTVQDGAITRAKLDADLQEKTDAVGDLKSAITNVSDLFIYEQPSITKDSGLMLLPVAIGDSITIERIDGQTFLSGIQLRFYDETGTYIGYKSTIPYDAKSRTFSYDQAKAATYIGITPDIAANSGEYLVINNSSKSLLLAEIKERKAIDSALSNTIDILDSQSAKAKIINRFNKETITAGKYINPNNGTLATNESFFASDFIYIGDLASVTVSYTHIFVWYDGNKNHLTPNPDPMNSGSQDLTFTRPEGAVYLRFSAYNTNLNSAQIGGAVSRNNYVPYGTYKLPELRINESQIEVSDESRIVVDASGSGDYTSFTQAIYATVDSGVDVIVKPGTYNIVSEYVALFGQSAVDSMADADSSTFNGFQYGVRLRKRKVEFAPGAHLVCDWTGHTVDGTHRFSALGVDYNVEIIGLDLDATATFYCIHDDYGIATPYTVKYENCRVVGHSIVNANCIGGGCKKYSRHILKNCYFDNNLTGSATVRYHNTNADGAEPEIYVSDCYFNNWFTPRWYGTQTSKMRVYVNNCEARSIHKMAESSSYNVDNVELYKWCNTETSPVT